MKIVRDDLRGSAVEDVVIEADDLDVVLTLSKELLARSLVSDFSEGEELHLDLGDPVIESPGVQIQPLAVFL